MNAAPPPAVVFHLQDNRIAESSGLVASPSHAGAYWTHNDSGDTSRLFAVDGKGRTLGVWRLRVAAARDWEAVTARTTPRPEIWVGDIGDNGSRRTNGILVHRMVEPARLAGGGSVAATSYRLRYPDGPHDAEAMFFGADGRLRIVTKSLLGGGIYVAPAALDASYPTVLRRVGDAPPVVTDGAELPDGGYVLRNYTDAFVYDADGRLRTSMALPDQPQGESVAVVHGGRDLLIGSEGEHSAVLEVPLPAEARRAPSASPTDRPATRPAGSSTGRDDNRSATSHQVRVVVGGAAAALALAVVLGVAARLGRRRARRRR